MFIYVSYSIMYHLNRANSSYELCLQSQIIFCSHCTAAHLGDGCAPPLGVRLRIVVLVQLCQKEPSFKAPKLAGFDKVQIITLTLSYLNTCREGTDILMGNRVITKEITLVYSATSEIMTIPLVYSLSLLKPFCTS